MKVVVVGDVSWKRSYHLGDEAMTEVAITELRRRGADVTLIAGDPEESIRFYGVHAVSQFGFRHLHRREEWERRLVEIVEGLQTGAHPTYATETLAAIKSSDAVLIAGGGNLNSEWGHHIFERLALTEAAKFFKLPLYASSQTVGPELRDDDRERLREVLSYARAFGSRESTTTALLREIAGDSSRVVQTLDDAFLLEPTDSSHFPEPTSKFIVGSFTFHPRTTELSNEEYYRKVAEILDDLAEQCDVDVELFPHMGSLHDDSWLGEASDAYGHERIVHYSTCGRIRSHPTVSAGNLLAVTSRALFTVSTRYHPVVFGASVATPAIGLVTSYYSAIRMRGALRNVGMEDFAVPFEAWTPLLGRSAIQAILHSLPQLHRHMEGAAREARAFQMHWWDWIVSDISGAGAPLPADFRASETITWAGREDQSLLKTARLAQEGLNWHRLQSNARDRRWKERDHALLDGLTETRKRLEAAEAALRDTRAELDRLQYRTRPPGAKLRDRVRLRLRELRR